MKKGIIIALLLSIITPLILAFLFLTLLTPISWTEMTGGVPQILAVLSFSSIGFGYSVPIFGYGYVIPLFIWIITGLFVGLFSKSIKKGAALTLVGMLIQVILFAILTTMNASYIPGFLQSVENASLIGGFSMDFFITLGLFFFWYAFTVPGGMIGSIMGGLVSRSSIPE